MPHVKPLSLENAPPDAQPILKAIEQKFGKPFLDDKQLVALAAAVALANFTNRVNHGLDIQLP